MDCAGNQERNPSYTCEKLDLTVEFFLFCLTIPWKIIILFYDLLDHLCCILIIEVTYCPLALFLLPLTWSDCWDRDNTALLSEEARQEEKTKPETFLIALAACFSQLCNSPGFSVQRCPRSIVSISKKLRWITKGCQVRIESTQMFFSSMECTWSLVSYYVNSFLL